MSFTLCLCLVSLKFLLKYDYDILQCKWLILCIHVLQFYNKPQTGINCLFRTKTKTSFFIRCFTIRYYIYVRSKADDMASLVWRTVQKQKIKRKIKTTLIIHNPHSFTPGLKTYLFHKFFPPYTFSFLGTDSTDYYIIRSVTSEQQAYVVFSFSSFLLFFCSMQ